MKDISINKPVNQHTPTPWTLNSGYNKIGMPVFEIKDSEGFNLLVIRGGMIPTPRDSEFIMRAVNSHEALLEAARLAFSRLSPKSDVKKDYAGHVAMAALSKAIAQAEGTL